MLVTAKDVEGKTFDYIVVGGGTAGIPLAARLSETASISVLLLEAGGAHLNDPVLLIPMQRMNYLGNPEYDWAFSTVEQPHTNNRSYSWNRGKGLGGSSTINNFLWTTPSREFIDAFAQLGSEGWNWELFEKYLRRAEKFSPPDHDLDILKWDADRRGQNGAVAITFPTVLSGLEKPMIETLNKFGVDRLLDPSSGLTKGSSTITLTVDPTTYQRSHSGQAFFQAIQSRENLVVVTNAQVTNIVTRTNDDGTVTATGVKFSHAGDSYVAHCAREVCLSAGAIMSPQILELSGIGDRAVLEKAGVEVKVDLPGVGTNVQEHLWWGLTYRLKVHEYGDNELLTYDALYNPEEAKRQFGLHSAGQGLLNLGVTVVTFLSLDQLTSDAPALQQAQIEKIRAGIREGKYPPGLQKQYELQLKHLEDKVPSLELMLGPGALIPPLPLDPTKRHMSFCFGLNSPFSRGTIHIASNNASDQPIIDPRIFEDSYDLTTLVEVVKFNRKLATTEPLSNILGEEVRPGPERDTDEQIAEWLKQEINTTWHTVGSCSMLPLEDGGVVDNKLKVHKTTNIRVADLSVVPLHIGSHTQATAFTLGEIAADIIKGKI